MPSGALDVVQAGPFLIDRGEPVIGLEATKLAWRSFLASDGHGNFAMGVISPVTLSMASTILLAAAPEVFPSGSLQRVLNLDGGSSTAFCAALQPDPFLLHEYVQVRNFLGLQLE